MFPEAPRSVSENTVVPVHGRVRLRHLRERVRCFTRFDQLVRSTSRMTAFVHPSKKQQRGRSVSRSSRCGAASRLLSQAAVGEHALEVCDSSAPGSQMPRDTFRSTTRFVQNWHPARLASAWARHGGRPACGTPRRSPCEMLQQQSGLRPSSSTPWVTMGRCAMLGPLIDRSKCMVV